MRWFRQRRMNHGSVFARYGKLSVGVQIEGDVDYFAGQWSISETSQGCLIRFACDFDLGIPGLDDILEPIAEQALRDNTRSILKGLIHAAEFPVGGAPDTVGAA